MPPNRTRSPGRMLAPVALLAFAVAVALIVLGSSGSDESADGTGTTTGPQATTTNGDGTPRRRRPRTTYTVKPGDTLGAIGQKTGVEVDTLQELNPSIDLQALVPGQKIKLRE